MILLRIIEFFYFILDLYEFYHKACKYITNDHINKMPKLNILYVKLNYEFLIENVYSIDIKKYHK
jgi:hypothetical protein